MYLYYDFHIHSCLSPCGDDDMTPANIANMSKLAGLDVIAITDHNSCGNCRSAALAGKNAGISVVPGMELTTREEVHVLCLFPDIENAESFGEYVYGLLPDIKNNEAIFGPQHRMDERDHSLGKESRMLSSASSIGIYEVAELMNRFDGIGIPAHIDRPSFSLLSNLGFFDPGIGLTIAEVTRNCSPGTIKELESLFGLTLIKNSDAHSLDHIYGAEHLIEAESASPAHVIDALRKNSKTAWKTLKRIS